MPAPAPVEPVPRIDPETRLAAPPLVLRPFQESDAEEIWPWVSDPAFPRMMSWPAHRDLDETRGHLRTFAARAQAGTSMVWAVTRDGAIVGNLGLLNIQYHQLALRVDRAELGYWTAPHVQGQGIARTAAAAAIAWAFEELCLHRVTVRCMVENPASRRVIEHLGFRFVARLAEDCYREGAWSDVLLYDLRASQWRADRADRADRAPAAPGPASST